MRNSALQLLLFFTLPCIVYSCGGTSSQQERKERTYRLTAGERELCAQTQVDSNLIIALRKYTKAPLNVFVPDPAWVMLEDGSTAEVSSHLNGLYFEAGGSVAGTIIYALSDDFQQKGHTIYRCEENFGTNESGDKIAIVPTTDKYTILKETGTDGINYDIDNDSLLKIIHRFDAKYDLTLIGANFDWCEFTFAKEPMNWMEMAEECYAVCPDMISAGAGE
jgi:hypothetical protein